jgi:ABC-type nitrate/sulfonate/bicarbonate transport system permease component
MAPTSCRVALLRIAIVATILVGWEAVAASGLLFRDVVPSLAAIARALARVLASADFYANLGVTAAEVGVALAIGGLCGLAVGILFGANRLGVGAIDPTGTG